jgi:hypothetical protein
MRKMLAILTTTAIAGGVLVAMMSAPALAASCSASASAPVAEANANMSSTGSGSCSGVASVKIQVCLQDEFHNPGGTTWSNWSCNSKTPAPGNTVSVTASTGCTAGHTYHVRTRTVSTGFNSSGGQVAQKTVYAPSQSGADRTCHN